MSTWEIGSLIGRLAQPATDAAANDPINRRITQSTLLASSSVECLLRGAESDMRPYHGSQYDSMDALWSLRFPTIS